MNRPFYSDYARHCLRFYSRNTEKPRFNTEVDEKNWYACNRAMDSFSDRDWGIILRVYSAYDTIADNVYEVAKAFNLDQNIIWDLMKKVERVVAKKRGLL